jgi:hypothetical protein
MLTEVCPYSFFGKKTVKYSPAQKIDGRLDHCPGRGARFI